MGINGLLVTSTVAILELKSDLWSSLTDSLSQRPLQRHIAFVCSLAAINFPHLMFIEICFY